MPQGRDFRRVWDVAHALRVGAVCTTLVAGCFASHSRSDGQLADAGAPPFDVGIDAGAQDADSVHEPDAGRRPDTGVDAGEPVQPCIEGTGGVLEGDVQATTLAQVMALVGIREVRGALRFNELEPDAAAALPAALGCLEHIEGDLEFSLVPSPLSLTSLARLRHVGGVRITGCKGLHDLKGLEFLTDLSGDLHLESDAELASLEALRNVTHVAGELFVGLTGVTSLRGLDSLAAVDGSVNIYFSKDMPDLEGLGSLVHVGGHLLIWDNVDMTSLAGMESLQSVGGDLAISANRSLEDLSALGALSAVGGGFGVYNNPLLSRCHGERLAKRLGRPCGWPGMVCEGLCTCMGNLNDITCAPDATE